MELHLRVHRVSITIYHIGFEFTRCNTQFTDACPQTPPKRGRGKRENGIVEQDPSSQFFVIFHLQSAYFLIIVLS